jgi:hypothetical protein
MLFGMSRDTSAEERVQQRRLEQREQDFEESYYLLLELCQRNPSICKCFHIIEAQVLHGNMSVYEKGKPVDEKFSRFLNSYYHDFARQALRAMFMYGFIPWRTRKLNSGDLVPEVLPPGTFTWHVAPAKAIPRELLHLQADPSRMLLYQVKMCDACNDVKPKDIHVYEYIPASWEVDKRSFYSSQSTPLSHIVSDFKKLQHALRNRAQADLWNSQAHIITKQSTKMMGQEPTSSVLEAGYGVNPVYTYDKCQLQLHTRDEDIQNMFTKKTNDHMPYVYTLPMDVSLEPTPTLTLCEDVDYLDIRFKQNVSFCMGIPYDMLVGDGMGSKLSASVSTSKENFKANMSNISGFLERLLRQVYFNIYYPENRSKLHQEEEKMQESEIDFDLHTVPPLQLETVDDLVKLAGLEGALTETELKRVVQQMLYGHVLPESASRRSSGKKKSHSNDSDTMKTAILTDESAAAGPKRKLESAESEKHKSKKG